MRPAAGPANLIQMPSSQNDKGILSILRTQVSDSVVLTVSGRMDAENTPQFEDTGRNCVAEGHTSVVVDLSGLLYISSMGLRSFLSLAQTLQTKGVTLRLCGLKGLVKQVFEITGLTQVLSVYESVDSAVVRG